MEIGLIEWFAKDKGFGVIKTPSNNEVFLHISNWEDSRKFNSTNKLPILFKIDFTQRKKTAINCIFFKFEKDTHWEILFHPCLQKFSFSVKLQYLKINLIELVFKSLPTRFDYSKLDKPLSKTINNFEDIDVINPNNFIYRTYNTSKSENYKATVFNKMSCRINKLNNLILLKFWRDKILADYTPNKNILINNYTRIKIEDLKRISQIETKNLIILKKLYYLTNNFNLNEFINFDKFYNFVDSNNLKNKISKDLNKIANTHYKEHLKQKINTLTQQEEVSYLDIYNFLNQQPNFLDDNFIKTIKVFLKNTIIANCSFRLIVECWKNDLIDTIETSIIKQISNQTNNDLIDFLSIDKIELHLAIPVIEHFFNSKEFELVLSASKKISSDLFEQYDKLVCNSVTDKQYFEFWKAKKGGITPQKFLYNFFSYKEESYVNLEMWIDNSVISKNEASNILFSIIKDKLRINDRYEFYTIFYAIKYLTRIDSKTTNTLTLINNPFISLILWHFKKSEQFNFETLKGKFIYFNPEDQVYILKRLFYLKYKGKLSFNIKQLDEILRTDVDLYLTNEKFKNDFVLDISTHIIIECIKSYVEKGHFIFESDLILKDLKRNSSRKFKIENYFDQCQGRMTASWDWQQKNGTITRVKENYNGKTFDFYKVEFEYNKDIVNDIKKMSKRRYYPQKKYWGVSLKCESELFEFAKKHHFFIELADQKSYSNNPHFAFFSRKVQFNKYQSKKNIPNGITFCEGKKAKKLHNIFNQEFWWCSNQECLQNSVTNHLVDEFEIQEKNKDIWESYTLLDFLHILNININEYNSFDFIKDGEYFKLLGHINAFNRLLERLYCEECNNLLYPKNIAHFALHLGTRFYCIEDCCSKKGKEVYLTNCLLGECNSIIDSRISNRCKHGLYICDNCGSCCSEDSFKKRLHNLELTGGYIHNELRRNVAEQNGHLEKKEYYCYKCTEMMHGISSNHYYCYNCEISYDFEQFKGLSKKWTQIDRRRKDYPTR